MTVLGGRKVDRTGRATGQRKTNRHTKIVGQFAPHRIDMLRSPAWRVLSLSARRVLDRVEIEMGDHGGTDNGRLPVTFLVISSGTEFSGTQSAQPSAKPLPLASFLSPSRAAPVMLNGGHRTASGSHSATPTTASRPTTGRRSRRSKKRKPWPERHAEHRRGKQIPSAGIRHFPVRDTPTETANPQCGKPPLQRQWGNPHYSRYLGVVPRMKLAPWGASTT